MSRAVCDRPDVIAMRGAAPVISNNDFTFPSTAYSALEVATGSEPEVVNNIFRCSSATNTSLYGIRIFNGSGGRYINNKLIGCKIAVDGNNAGYDAAPGLPTNPLIANNEIIGTNYGLYIVHSEPVVMNNSFEDISQYGIYIYNSNPVIFGNYIRAAQTIPSTYVAVYLAGNPAEYPIRIANNVMLGNGTQYGLRIDSGDSSPLVVNNIITGHATDIYLYGGHAKIMFNVFDRIVFSAGVGDYNMDSAGNPIAVP